MRLGSSRGISSSLHVEPLHVPPRKMCFLFMGALLLALRVVDISIALHYIVVNASMRHADLSLTLHSDLFLAGHEQH